MTGFREIKPALKADGTGVKVSLSERNGLIVTIWREALERLGGGDPGTAKAYIDFDPAFPRLRIERHHEGLFKITVPQKGGDKRLVRIGYQAEIKAPSAKGLECSWEDVDGKCAIDIDLPREFFPNATRTEQASLRAPSSSMSTPQRTPVTLARVGRD